MFLDIQMPDISGIDFIKTLSKKPLTVLTTAYMDYAIEGYALDVMDYLVKPFAFERFACAYSRSRGGVKREGCYAGYEAGFLGGFGRIG